MGDRAARFRTQWELSDAADPQPSTATDHDPHARLRRRRSRRRRPHHLDPGRRSGWNQGSAEATLWQLLNGARVNNGRAPLQQHSTLISLARWRSADMLAKDYFSHTIAGCGCLVYAYYDSNGLSYDWAGENIGWNSGVEDSYSPVRVHEKFMASPGHRANVLDPSFTHGGVGAAAADNQMYQGYVQNTRMYTELFMEARGSGSAPPPSGGGGGGSGGSGGGGSTAPAQPAAQAPARDPEAGAELVSVDRPQRPESSAGLDGVAELVTERVRTVVAGRMSVDDVEGAMRRPRSPPTRPPRRPSPAASSR